jgi:5-methylthioadenosine/S-adenosylhomocysteine deaminase
MNEKPAIDLAITGAHILTIDHGMTEYESGTIHVSGGRIAWIGPDGQAPADVAAREKIDAGGKLAMPVFFNSHSHAAMSILRGLGNDLPLDRWLNDFIWPAEHSVMTRKNVYLGTLLSAIEMVKSGTGIFSDMYFFEDEVARACETIGMRGIVGEAVFDFPSPSRANPDESFRFIRELHREYRDHPLISVSIALHSPYTCSPDVIRKAAQLAGELRITANIHLAETETEFDTILGKYGKTPTRHLYDLDLLSRLAVAHHSIYLTEEDMELIRETGTHVVTLPGSNMKLGSGTCKVSRMRQLGINIAVGTDGPASNNKQSMVNDMQLLARLERVMNMDPTCLPAGDLIRMATINGARAYRLDHELGSLETGKKADIQLIDTSQPHWHPHFNAYASLAYAMQSGDVDTVIVEGKTIMRNRVMVNIDEEQVYAGMREFSGRFRS